MLVAYFDIQVQVDSVVIIFVVKPEVQECGYFHCSFLNHTVQLTYDQVQLLILFGVCPCLEIPVDVIRFGIM